MLKLGGTMVSFDLTGTLKSLQVERAQAHKEVSKLDKAIGVLRGLSSTHSTPNTNGKRRTLSAAARRKIAKAQKLRWEKFRQTKRAKA
jgi:hypothetical protein